MAVVRQDNTGWIVWRDYAAVHTGDPFFFVELDATLRASGDAMAGEVTSSNTPLIPVGTPVRLERGSDQYTMNAIVGESDSLLVCNEDAPPGHCGA